MVTIRANMAGLNMFINVEFCFLIDFELTAATLVLINSQHCCSYQFKINQFSTDRCFQLPPNVPVQTLQLGQIRHILV